jgi:hypothetical protein
MMKITDEDPMRHHSLAYPMDVGAPKFELVPITQQKDVMLNVARMHAQQEYDRIMDLVAVLQRQADGVKRRLEVTDWVHAAKYEFQVHNGETYWLAHDLNKGGTLLTRHGPDDWACGAPKHYDYICQVKWLGDYTWIEVEK